jgi:hypothetical protein
MRVNLIGDFTSYGIAQDARVCLEFLKLEFGEDVQVFKISTNFPECNEADINIFFDKINPSLVSYAGKNIWILNHEWCYKNAVTCFSQVDEVWARCEQTFQILLNKTSTTNFRSVSLLKWTSVDKHYSTPKNYTKAVVLTGKNSYRSPIKLFKAYCELKNTEPETYAALPTLTIPFSSTFVKFNVPEEISEKVTLIDEFLSEKDYDDLLGESGLAICISVADSFSHSVNEAMSSGCNMLLSGIPPFKEMASSSENVLWAEIVRRIEHPYCLGSLLETSMENIIACLKSYVGMDEETKQERSKKMREMYERNHTRSVDMCKHRFKTVMGGVEYSLKKSFPEDLPEVSVVTVVNGNIDLAKYCFSIQAYAADKLEWIVVNDGSENIAESLSALENVKYIHLDGENTLGEKYNIGIKNATKDVITIMTTEDVYNEKSIIQRAIMLLKKDPKQCAFCVMGPCYDVTKDDSYMSIPVPTSTLSETVHFETLIFTKKFWENRNFPSSIENISEFIDEREEVCRVLSPKDIMIKLVYSKEVSESETNGCHYGFSEEIQELIPLFNSKKIINQ